ncbi:Clp protease N-terminal domain-containing protein [Nocardiopsis sp. CNT-189]|uniref:Clp protease N-terminal domain-containing protein n=1 Tax=Nocardiopsis oceanisediminis TaxID=2816862 RepID=UPI003B3ACEDA
MMPGPSAKPAFGNGFDRTLIQGAASREAMRTGRTEVGFEHMLLGVLMNGGPAARLMMDAGVGLAEARSAIDALLKEDLALLGIEAPLPAPSDPPGGEGPQLLPLTPRLRELEEDCPSAGGDRALLAALIDDEGGRARRLLDRVGADPDRIRAALDAAAPAPPGKEGGAPGGEARGPEGGERIACELEVPVPAEHLWALVADPDRRGEWELPAAASSRRLDGGAVELTDDEGAAVRERIVHSVPGREVTWAREDEGVPTPRTLRVTVEPLGGRARLRLEMRWETAVRNRLANRFVRWINRKGLHVRAQAIAQAAAA